MLNSTESTVLSQQPPGPRAPRRQRRRRDAAAWRAVIAEQRDSGLSIAAFCEARGIAPSSFYVWRRRLTGDGEARPHSASTATASEAQPAGFVRLEPASASRGPSAASAAATMLEVRFDRGATLCCPADRLDELVSLLLADPDSDAGDHRC